ncbi:hypothetical protein [Sinomonas sp.]|uniref:hypothetical protein n=1 Tax=Sinomonas sp. TaxID=1914986 RepID=UPI003F7E0295
MRPGDVALVRPAGWLGRIITTVTSARYCHIRLIVAEDGSTVEANPPGAYRGKIQPGDVIVTAPLTDEERAQIATTAAALVGIPYGFLDVVALGLAQYGIKIPGLRKRLGRKDRLFCSQLVDRAWQAVGFHAFTDDRLPQNVSPGDIADLAFVSSWTAEVEP